MHSPNYLGTRPWLTLSFQGELSFELVNLHLKLLSALFLVIPFFCRTPYLLYAAIEVHKPDLWSPAVKPETSLGLILPSKV